MAGAAGSFVTRSFDAMLKECAGKKYGPLQKAIQAFIDSTKATDERPISSEKIDEATPPGDESSLHSQSTVAAEAELSNEGITPDGLKPISTDEKADGVTNAERNAEPIAIALSSAGHTLEGAQAELVLQPLRLAFETKNIKLVEPALDCLHKLIAYDHLEGDPGLDGGKNATLFTDILNMVCSSVDNSSSDSTILQVLKVLLTAVASAKFSGKLQEVSRKASIKDQA